MIGVILQIPELSDLRVRNGKAVFRVADEKTYLDSLVLETPDLQFTTKGNIRFDGKLSLDAQLAVSGKLAEQLPGFVKSNFTADGQGRQTISFDITGKTDKPKTNLVDRVIGKQITGQVGDLLGGLFGKPKEPKEKKEKKKKEPEPAAAVEPAAVTAPAPASATPPTKEP